MSERTKKQPPHVPSCDFRPDILVCAGCGLRDPQADHNCPRADEYRRLVEGAGPVIVTITGGSAS